MYLVRLSANKPSFHTINFNEGLNFIVGGIKDKTNNEKKTYNGVGKSLMIKIIHFCLGSNPIDQFKQKLEDWEFSLVIQIGKDEYEVTRNCSNQRKIFVDGKEYSLNDFREFLGNKLFNLNKNDYKYLKYRSLISRFIRPNKYAYDSYDKFVNEEKDYQKNICNAYLLGLNVKLVDEKRELIEKKKKIIDAKSLFEKDDTIKKFYEKDEKIDVTIVDLEQKIISLNKEIDNFKVADNYYEIRKEADNQQKELADVENDLLLIKDALENINNSLDIKVDISTNKIIKMYEEAKVKLNDMVVKELKEVEDFHNKLVENRIRRLKQQKKDLIKSQNEKEILRKNISTELDKNLNLLGAYGALDEYNALINKLSQYKAKLEKLNSYKDLIENYKNEINTININLEQENINTNKYLKESKEIREQNILVFRELTHRFYPNKTGGIQIENNDGDNLNRYTISASIEDDTSDGVNGVKIFCYDYTMLLNGFNHNVRCLIHDSRLFSDIDPRQKGEAIKIANEYTNEYGFQYIVSLNEDFIDSIGGISSEEEFEEIKGIIDKNTVLHLTDNDAEGKLLGIQVDLKYEE